MFCINCGKANTLQIVQFDEDSDTPNLEAGKFENAEYELDLAVHTANIKWLTLCEVALMWKEIFSKSLTTSALGELIYRRNTSKDFSFKMFLNTH